MKTFRSTAGAWLELARVSNLPTVVTNTLVGAAAGVAATGAAVPASEFPWIEALAVAVAMSAFYIGGMILNDVADLAVDRDERPNRPLPSGRVSRDAALIAAVGSFALGLGVLAAFGRETLAAGFVLVAVVVAYDLLHLKSRAAVVLMGLARAMVYITAALAAARGDLEALDLRLLAVLAGAMLAYIVLLSLVAREETRIRPGSARWLGLLLPIVALAPAVLIHRGDAIWSGAVGGMALAWILLGAVRIIRRPVNPARIIMDWLAAICLIDAFSLTLLDRPTVALLAVAAFFATTLAHRRVVGS